MRKHTSHSWMILLAVLLLAVLSFLALYANGGELQGRFGKSSIMEVWGE